MCRQEGEGEAGGGLGGETGGGLGGELGGGGKGKGGGGGGLTSGNIVVLRHRWTHASMKHSKCLAAMLAKSQVASRSVTVHELRAAATNTWMRTWIDG